MDLVNYEQAALHTRAVNHREGSFRYKDLGQGTPGRPENFYLRMVWTEGDFFSPRHMHNFDQVRVQIKGRFSFDKDGTMHPGCIGYFPEGTPYGPQTSAEDTIQLDHLQEVLVRGMQKHVEMDEPEEAPELEQTLFGIADPTGPVISEDEVDEEAVEEELEEDLLAVEDDIDLPELPADEDASADEDEPAAEEESADEEP